MVSITVIALSENLLRIAELGVLFAFLWFHYFQ